MKRACLATHTQTYEQFHASSPDYIWTGIRPLKNNVVRMKNVVLAFVLLFAAHVAFGQATPVAYYRIANNATAIGVNISVGTQVFDATTQKLYVALRAVPSAVTITTGLADASPYFKEMGGGTLSVKPSASNVSIGGGLYVGNTVTGSYTFVPDEVANALEGSTTFKWYQANDAAGAGKSVLAGATTTSYLVGSLAGKYLAFGVTPANTIPATGAEVLSSPWQYIYATGVTASLSLTTDPGLYAGQQLTPVPTFTPATAGTCDQTANATYTWYRNSSASKIGATTISTGTGTSPGYTVLDTDINLYIGLEVIPDATCNAAVTPGIDWKQVLTLTPVYANATLSGLTNSKAKTGTTITAVKGTYSTTPTNITASEGTPTYQWYWGTDASGAGKTAIAGQTAGTHGVDKTLYGYTDGNFLAVGITPKTVGGLSGTEVLSNWVMVNTNLAPVASVVTQTGSLNVGFVLTGSYTYTDADSDPQGTSTFKWYRSDNSNGAGATEISGATTTTYTLTSGDAGKYIGFAVTPVASSGITTGSQVIAGTFSGPVFNSGTPVVELASTSGRVWMDRNVGASQAATSSTDYLAYGSLFQWVRKADGHEKINWTSPTAGTAVNGTTAGPIASTSPANSYFFVGSGDWLNPSQANGNLWWSGTATGANNPCPTGYHVPTKAEWDAELALFAGKGGRNATGAFNHLKLPLAGVRGYTDGAVVIVGSSGRYWSSSVNGTVASILNLESNSADMSTGGRANGASVRCVKDAAAIAADGTILVELASTSGRVWMDRNIGASQAATSSTDYWAYGSLFQWVRKADGHEQMNWISPTAGTPANGTVAGPIATTSPAHSLFVTNGSGTYDWLSTQQANGNLWWSGTAAGANNPCPTGYHVPTKAEWDVEVGQGITNAATAYSKLKLPMAGYRSYSNGALGSVGSLGTYWSSSVTGTGAFYMYFDGSSNNIGLDYRANASSVRCVKDAPLAPDGTTEVLNLTSTSGRVWMDRNLGATQAATGYNDYLAYGSLFQWARKADGHEKINWTSSTAGTPVNGTTAGPIASTSPGNSLFVITSGVPNDWLSTQQANGNLWWSGTAAGANSPCPTGYHVPTNAEWDVELAQGITNFSTAYSKLKLPSAGYRNYSNGSVMASGSYGEYWSSSVIYTAASYLNFYSSTANVTSSYRANGMSVRCVKDAAAITADGTILVDMTSTSGRVWMDRNLGAARAATSSADYLAYGSLFQWVRKADGHEKINWTSSSAGTPVNGTTAGPIASTSPGNSLFVTNSTAPVDWLSTQQSDGSLWWSGTAAGANSPCPTGYHVPTKAEWDAEVSAGITNASTAYSKLKLTVAGYRDNSNGSLASTASYGNYWSSSVNGTRASYLTFDSGFVTVTLNVRAYGYSVRCVKN